jgi:hypothetical protein
MWRQGYGQEQLTAAGYTYFIKDNLIGRAKGIKPIESEQDNNQSVYSKIKGGRSIRGLYTNF